MRRLPREYRTGFNRTERPGKELHLSAGGTRSLSPPGPNKTFRGRLGGASLSVTAFDQPWPHAPPKIGKLKLKQEYWGYIKEAAQRYHISPYLIQAVCAIESRYDPKAKSGKGRCLGLMQLEKDTAKKYGVDAHDPRENIMGGAVVLARLMQRYTGISGKCCTYIMPPAPLPMSARSSGLISRHSNLKWFLCRPKSPKIRLTILFHSSVGLLQLQS